MKDFSFPDLLGRERERDAWWLVGWAGAVGEPGKISQHPFREGTESLRFLTILVNLEMRAAAWRASAHHRTLFMDIFSFEP